MSNPPIATVHGIDDVEFGATLPATHPDTSVANVLRFVTAAHMPPPRFTDHEAARREGLPGALLPGIMSQGFFAAAIHRWAPTSTLKRIDTVFRAPAITGEPVTLTAVVTDIDHDAGTVEIDLTLANDKGETRVFGTATIGF